MSNCRKGRKLGASLLSALAAAAAAPVFLWSSGAEAARVEFPRAAPGGTGNSYEVVLDPGASFEAAAGAAAAAGGHLATINSAAEQAFIEGLLAGDAAPTGAYWFGLAKTADPSVNVYINGEPVTFENFAPGEPANQFGHESKFVVLWTDAAGGPNAGRAGTWNDVPSEGYPNGDFTPTAANSPDWSRAGYIVEFVPTDNGPGPTPIPLPAAAYAFPLGAVVAGIAARRFMRRR